MKHSAHKPPLDIDDFRKKKTPIRECTLLLKGILNAVHALAIRMHLHVLGMHSE